MSEKEKIENWLIGLRFTEVCKPPTVETEQAKEILKEFAENLQTIYTIAMDKTEQLKSKTIRFFEDNKIVHREQDIKSKNCEHSIVVKEVEGTNIRYCKHCSMLAHEDESFHYGCGFEHCKCMN